MINKKSKGFTIIELLVVVAIIAVLASIVLISVTQYIVRGRDAAAQGNLASMLTNGAVFFDTNSTFAGFLPLTTQTGTFAAGAVCTGAAGFANPCSAVTGAPNGTAANAYSVLYACGNGTAAVPANCNTAPITAWCVSITLKGAGTPTYCTDSSGTKKTASLCQTTVATAGICS